MVEKENQVDKNQEEEQKDTAQTNDQNVHEEDQDATYSTDQDADQYQAEVSLWKDQCRRVSAEFENFKKRTQRDQVRWSEMAKESVLLDLLTLVDDFDRAMQQDQGDKTGIEMMYNSCIKLLEKNGVTLMTSYDEFDPSFHEAIMQVDSQDHKTGHVVEVFSKGFMIKDRVLRPAKVSVAK